MHEMQVRGVSIRGRVARAPVLHLFARDFGGVATFFDSTEV
jgi:hypothetical protein